MRVDSDPNGLPLQKVLRDLVALSAVPSVWVGRESRAIAADLADLLATLLNLDFAFVHLRDSDGGAAAEMTHGTAPPALLERVQQCLDGRRRLSHPEIVPGAGACNAVQGAGIVFALGVNSEMGLVAAGSDRPEFPSEIDQMLLSVAAGHGATAFRMARLVEEHRRAETALAASERQLRQARDELETKVAERTAELRRSEAYLAEAEGLSHTGTWAVKDLKGERVMVYFSEESYRIFGFDPRRGVSKREATWQQIHPDDRGRVYEETQEAERQKKDFLVEFRLLLPDGTVKYVETVGHHVYSAGGALLEIMGTHVDLTERKRAQAALRESEAKFRDFAESASDWFWEFGPDLKFTQLTGNAFGSDAARRIGTACWDHALDLETEPEKWRLVSATLESRKPFRDFVYCTTGGDGSPMYVKTSGKPVFDASGEFRGYRGTGTDVTATVQAQEEREELTQELQRREGYLADAQRLSHTGSFGWKPDTDEIVWSDETYSIFEYDRSVKPTIDSVVQRVHSQDRADLQKVIADASRGATDFEHTYRLLLPGGRVKHVHALAHALQDASGNREFVGAVTDITERKTAEEALRTSEAYLAEAQRLSHTGSWAWRLDTDVRHWSEECYRILGFDPRDGSPRLEELIQRVHPDDQPAFREAHYRARHNQLDEQVDYRIVHPDGAVKDIHSIGHPVFGPRGDLIEYTGTVIDITERKRAEEDLRASERKYRHLVDTTPAFIHTALPDGSLDFLSRGWLEYGGLPQTDILDWRWTAAIHPEDVEGFVDKWRAALASGEPFEAESRVRRADGVYRWFLQRNVPLRDESGNIVKWYGTGIDIEERRAAEESLRSSEAYLAEAQKLSHTGSWAWSPDQDIRYWSEECYRVLSFEPRDGLPRFEDFLERIHPDDQPGFRELIETAIREKEAWEADYRIVHPDGPVRDIHSIGHPVLSASGHLVEFVGTVIDVTERRRAEQRLLVQYRVTRILADASTVGEATPKILQAMCECLGWDLGAVWRIDPKARVLCCAELWRTSSVEAAQFEVVTRKSTFRLGSGLPGRVWETGAPAYIPEVGHDEAFRGADIPAPSVVHAAIAFPILLAGEVIGVIGFISRNVSQPDQDLLVALTSIGSQIGQFTKRTAAVHELQLRVSMLQNIPVAAWSVTPDGTPDIVTQAWFEYTGHDGCTWNGVRLSRNLKLRHLAASRCRFCMAPILPGPRQDHPSRHRLDSRWSAPSGPSRRGGKYQGHASGAAAACCATRRCHIPQRVCGTSQEGAQSAGGKSHTGPSRQNTRPVFDDDY